MRYYHGTSDAILINSFILPPSETDCKRETHRNKLTDVVFFTTSLPSAIKYAKKASVKFGGNPLVYVVEPVGEVYYIANNEYVSEKAIIIGNVSI